MTRTAQQILDSGDIGTLGPVFRALAFGSLLAEGSSARLVRESVPVASDAATPSYAIRQLLHAKVSGGSTGNGEKTPSENGSTAIRVHREVLPVATNAATPSYPIKRLVSAKVITADTGNGEKYPALNGDAGVRMVKETVNVATAAATPTWPILQLLYCQTVGTGAAAVKACDINGATPGTGHAAPNSGGTSVVLNAEETGTGTAVLVYLTDAAVATPNAAGTSLAFKASEVTGAGAMVNATYQTVADCATPNAAGTSIAFFAGEVTGADAVVELIYVTSDPPLNDTGHAAALLTDNITGI